MFYMKSSRRAARSLFTVAVMVVVMAVVMAVALGTGCRREAEGFKDVQVELKTDPRSLRVGKAALTLLVTDGDGAPIEGAKLKLEGNMSHAGMKPVFADASEEKAGRYRAELEFTMGGDWFILIDGRRADGRPFRKKIEVKGVRSE